VPQNIFVKALSTLNVFSKRKHRHYKRLVDVFPYKDFETIFGKMKKGKKK
jgi:hypothetical protein